MEVFNFIPEKINGWALSKDEVKYTPDNLHNYINGGAELYISYQFTETICYRYESAGHPDITVDIFDMTYAKNAYGVFSLSSEKNDSLFGQGSQYIEGSLIFWKGKYFISIFAGYETPESKKAVLELGTHIDKGIAETGVIPDIISILTDSGLIKNSIKYFNNYAWQNTYYFISDENIFNIHAQCDAVLANYTIDNKTCSLLLIQYPTQKEAEDAHNRFMVNFFDEFIDEPTLKLENEKWMTCRFKNNFVYAIFNASNKECIEKISGSITNNIKLKNE